MTLSFSSLSRLPGLSPRAATCSVLLAAALVSACSPRDSAAQPGGGSGAAPAASKTGTVAIVRERKLDDPQAYLKMVRTMVARCQEAKSAIAQAQGRSYDPQSEAISDEEILRIDTQRTEEYFDGPRYTSVVESNMLDHSKFGPDQSCKPQGQRAKDVTIHTADCRVIDVHYDLSAGGGTRQESEPACEPQRGPSSAVPTGEVTAIPASAGNNLQCQWNVAEGQAPIRVCLLAPLHYYPQGQRDLTVAISSSSKVLAPTTPVADINMIAAGQAYTEQPVKVQVGQPLPDGIFDVPADSKSFPVEGS